MEHRMLDHLLLLGNRYGCCHPKYRRCPAFLALAMTNFVLLDPIFVVCPASPLSSLRRFPLQQMDRLAEAARKPLAGQ